MSYNVLMKEENKHLVALAFCAEEEYTSDEFSESLNSQVLTFRNSKCVFEEAKTFHFFTNES